MWHLECLIQATVNTVQETDFKERENKKRMNQFYLVLEKSLNLQYGKILLATSSPSQLEDLIAKDVPYFSVYTSQVKDCLHEDSCQGVENLVTSLGNNLPLVWIILHLPGTEHGASAPCANIK